MTVEGWIDEVQDGQVYGRLYVDDELFWFDMALTDVLECQRGYIEPGVYVSFPNGYLLVNKTILTTHDIETAQAEADRMYKALGWAADYYLRLSS